MHTPILFMRLITLGIGVLFASSVEATDWYCLCYKEIDKGQPTPVTTCRSSAQECSQLSQRVSKGSKVIVKGSQNRPCTVFKGAHPSTQMGHHKVWRPSKKKGAWWTPQGCFIPMPKPSQILKGCQAKEEETLKGLFQITSIQYEEATPPEEGEEGGGDCDRAYLSGEAHLLSEGGPRCVVRFGMAIGDSLTQPKRARLIKTLLSSSHRGEYMSNGFCYPELTLKMKAD